MKRANCLLVISVLVVAGASCKKSSGSANNGGSQGSNLVRIQQGVDPTIANDSVYLLKYDSKNRLNIIIDSLNQDTLTATYNGTGQLTAIQETYGDGLTATYNSSGQLTEIDDVIAGSQEQYVFTYSGPMPSKCTYSTNSGAGTPLAVWRYYAYSVTGENITDIKEYNASNTLLGERKLTFAGKANPFQTLSLFNWGNRLGTQDIISVETFFDASMTATTEWDNATNNPYYTTYQTTTLNNSAEPVKIIASEQAPGGVVQNLFTWGFSYK